MLNPHDPLAFRINKPISREESSEKKVLRHGPTEKPKKDFEKVMKRKDDKSSDETRQALTRKDRAKNEDQEREERSFLAGIARQPETASALQGMAAREGIETRKGYHAGEENPEFLREQPDFIGIGHQHSEFNREISLTGVDESQRADPAKRLEQILDLIVNKIYTLKQEGKTDTLVTMRHPPMFEGAQLKISSYETAPGEYNITLSDLRPEAKALFDMQNAEQGLQRALEQRGYVAHIIVATTEKEELTARKSEASSAHTESQRRQKDEEERQGEEQQ